MRTALQRVTRALAYALVVAALLLIWAYMLMILEATGGHDGWLCEWGYDTDGAGTGTTGCG